MKIKILDKINWIRFPTTEDMIDLDISEQELLQIGKTLCFDIENNYKLIPYENLEISLQTKLKRLEELTKDFAQVQAGLIIEDIEDRKLEFQTLLNEVRVLQGKEPRLIQGAEQNESENENNEIGLEQNTEEDQDYENVENNI